MGCQRWKSRSSSACKARGPTTASRSAAPSPTANLIALAAAGRDPADVTIPTIGSKAASGEDGGSSSSSSTSGSTSSGGFGSMPFVAGTGGASPSGVMVSQGVVSLQVADGADGTGPQTRRPLRPAARRLARATTQHRSSRRMAIWAAAARRREARWRPLVLDFTASSSPSPLPRSAHWRAPPKITARASMPWRPLPMPGPLSLIRQRQHGSR